MFFQNSIEIIITNNILGIKDETVSPYNDEISMCLRLGFISSSFILSTIIAVIKPVVNIQNSIFIRNLKKLEDNNTVTDCNQ